MLNDLLRVTHLVRGRARACAQVCKHRVHPPSPSEAASQLSLTRGRWASLKCQQHPGLRPRNIKNIYPRGKISTTQLLEWQRVVREVCVCAFVPHSIYVS